MLLISVFFTGSLNQAIHSYFFLTKDYAENYLSKDYLVGEIIDYQIGNNQYDKAIVSVENIVRYFSQEQIPAQGDLLCYIRKGASPYEVGDVILFQSAIIPITNKNNPGEFDAVKYWKSKGIRNTAFIQNGSIQILDTRKNFTSFWVKSRKNIEQIVNRYVAPENQALVIALTLGDKSRLSMEDKSSFTNAGAMHVLAVSGMHVGILLLFIQFVFKQIQFLRKRSLYLITAIVLLWGFAFLTGMSASVLRAVLMFTILAIGKLLGQKFFSLNAILASALLLLLYNPLFIFDIGFQLSYLAVLGISLFFKPITELFYFKSKIIHYFWEGTALGLAAQIGTLPITLYYFNQFPNYFLLTNIGVLVMASAAMISVVVLVCLSFIPFLNQLLGWLVDFIFSSFSTFIAWVDQLPGGVSIGFSIHYAQVLLLYLSILILLYFKSKENIKYFRMGMLVTFLLLVSVLFVREENKMKEELIVLNHTEKVILIKQPQKLFILYEIKEGQASKINDFLIKGYENAIGIKGEHIPFVKGEQIQITSNCQVLANREGVHIDYYGQQLLLADILPSNSASKIVKGAWNPYLTDHLVDYSVLDEALIIQH